MSEMKRLHLAAIFVSFLKGLRDFIIPIVVSFFLGGTNQAEGFFRFEYIWLAILIFMFLYGVAHWFTFRYQISDGELYVQKGIVVKKKRYIQKKRIQSIDISAGIVQRLFGLVRVKIETAGGGAEPEVNLIAVTKEEAETIRHRLLHQHTQKDELQEVEGFNEMGEAREVEPDESWDLGRRRLVIAALTSSGIGLTLSAVGALFSQIEQFIPETIYERTFGFVFGGNISFLFGLLLTIFLIAWMLSSIGTILKYGSFKIEKFDEELVITRGLLEQRQLSLHLHRITAIRLVRNIFRQPFGYTSIYVESAGGGSNEEQLSTVLIPLIHVRELEEIFNRFLQSYPVYHDLHPAPKRALIRFIIRNTMIPLIGTVLASYYFFPYGYVGAIVIIVMVFLAYLQYRDTGIAVKGSFIWLRFRKLSQVTVIATKNKIQTAEKQVSFLQGKRNLSNVQISVLSSIVGKTFLVRDIESHHGDSCMGWYSYEKNHDRAE
ncbi:PH domain-containing protein [Halalkalibacter urbisdiaboli]|uniref:PH domain-containing protein n=1 Tax=Halalkalibacter urbisdiaboli TaxID=1960589 RepID=UPI000B448624|nr:PH domain-containing protein [Halalkalibacter urbisdiaboli]